MSEERLKAQEWHDAQKHGDVVPYSSCWCCCELCDPDWEPPVPNPYWAEAAKAVQR